MLGLPDRVRACLFDLDGVITRTAAVHAAAWKEMFDEFLREWAERTSSEFVPFDIGRDYGQYVDGKRREDGTRSFLESRGIRLPDGTPDDPPEALTIYGLGNRKNTLVLSLIEKNGVEVFEGSVTYIKAARAAGLRTAVVSSSANTRQVLEVTGLADLFDARVDGLTAQERGLPGKPAPDMFLAGATEVGATAETSVVFEDALAGVQAGRAGGFAYVIGIDRVGDGHAQALRERGADIVVEDLTELLEENA